MQDENELQPQQDPAAPEENYLDTIRELQKRPTKEAYDKLARENKSLLDSIVNGTDFSELAKKEKEDTETIADLRKALFSDSAADLTNLEYAEKALKLRQMRIESGARDPFLPCGNHVRLTGEQYEQAENVATVLQECIDLAKGDSGVFTAELQRRTRDTYYSKR